MGQQDLARGDLRQGVDLLGAQALALEQATLDEKVGVVLGELSECPGHGDRVAGRTVLALAHEGHRGRPDKQVLEVEAQLLNGEPHQGVLVDLVLAAGIAQRTAQFGECGYVQTAVFGQHDRFGRRQSLTDLVDDRDLPGPGFLLVRHSRSLPRNWSC